MLRVRTFMLSVALLLACNKILAVKSANSDSLQVIIACLLTEQKYLDDVQELIQSDPSLQYIGYCPQHSIFLLTMSGDRQTALDLAERVRKSLNAEESQIFLKDVQFGDIREHCSITKPRVYKKGEKKQ